MEHYCNELNTLWINDNLLVLSGLNSESIDLIYLDPPFNSKRVHAAPVGSRAAGTSFKDMWAWEDVDQDYLERMINEYPNLMQYISAVERIHGPAMMAYLLYMAQRIVEMRRVLKNTGSLYLHCDPTASHYLKIILDCIFGDSGFLNEVIWHYTGGGRAKRYFSRKHDVLFWYRKSTAHTFNIDAVRVPYKQKSGYAKVGITSKSGKKYIPNARGTPVDDVWDIPIINPMSKERTGYPTQKPLNLLNRIIKASSNKGDIVLDPFCGCATTCVSAQSLGRKWIGIDIEARVAGLLKQRLENAKGLCDDFAHRTDIPQRTDIEIELPHKQGVKESLYDTQEHKCNGCKAGFECKNLAIDHIIPRSRGGSDCRENYQLLCRSCNRDKQEHPMEYLKAKITAMNELSGFKTTFGGF